LYYEFKYIETLIRNAIDSSADQSISKEQFDQVRNAVAKESVRIKNTFALKVLSFQKSRVEQFVRYHQQALINLLNHLGEDLSITDKAQSTNNESHVNEFVKFSSNELEEILRFFQNHFHNHFDLDVCVPEFVKERVLKALKESSILLEGNLSKFEIDQALLSICINAVTDLLKEPDLKITYRRVNWIKELIAELLQLGETNQEGASLNAEVQSVLLHLNYNTTFYLKYCTDIINRELLTAETLTSKLEKLAFHYKVSSQSRVKPDFVFDLASPSLKEQLSEWILEEIQFLERKQQLGKAFPSTAEEPVTKDFKLVFDMSVSQFAYFIKTLTETGVIQNKNVSELIRFLAKFVKTKRSENISYESFRIKYYNAEDNTKGAVRNLLHAAIGYINNS
jgi:hypothetical protein